MILQYVSGDSFFHKLHPLTKIIWAILTGILCFITQNLYLLLVVTIINILIIVTSGIAKEGRAVYKLFFIISLILLFFTVFFNTTGEKIFHKWFIIITKEGIVSGLSMVFRMLGALLPISMVIMLTPINSLAAVMAKNFHIPYKYVFVVITILRFIPTLHIEMEQIIQAQVSRGCELDRGGPIRRFGKLIPLMLPLLVSSVKRTEKTAVSLEIRGFGSGKRSSYRRFKHTLRDFFIYVMLIVLYATAIFL